MSTPSRGTTDAGATAGKKLIPRSKLFGNPERAMGRLSSDGRWLSWLAPKDGVLNVWIAPFEAIASGAVRDGQAGRPLTNDTKRGIRMYFWARDNRHLLYIQDRDGDEDWHVYAVDVETGIERDLTPMDKVTARIQGLSWDYPGQLVIGLNDRDPAWHDLWYVDLVSGERERVLLNDKEYGGFTLNRHLRPMLAQRSTTDGGTEILRIDQGAEDLFLKIGYEDALSTSPLGFTADDATLYLASAVGRDTSALIAHDWSSSRETVIAEHGKADVSDFLAHPTSNVVEAWSANHLRTEWHPIGEAIAGDLAFLDRELPGEFAVTSRTKADDLWLVAQSSAKAPGVSHLYDRKAGTLTRLYATRPDLEGEPLTDMHPVVIPARDGLELVSYLSLPAKVTGTRPDAPLPMVLAVHGGPWARDAYGYDAQHQWLADRGYAVLSVNFRGSTGFGKAFLNAGDLQWGRKMHDDLIDAVEWAIDKGIADRHRIAIMGGSYGGYAALAGLAFTPDVFACGVDIVGPSNLETLLATVPPYWAAFFENLARRVGDPRTPEGVKLLKERSPLNSADRIARPLLIGQGANDPRVKQAESDQIVAAMQAKGLPVTYALYPDEGHGFARPENRLSFNAVAEAFLAAHLGGAAESLDGVLAGSTLTVPEGADHIPGLLEAKS